MLPILFGPTLAYDCTQSNMSLVFGQTAAFSNPTSQIALELNLGLELAFNETNKIFGGVGGFLLEIRKQDNGGSAVVAVNQTWELAQSQVLAIVGSTNSQASIGKNS